MKSFSLFPAWMFRMTFKYTFRNTQAWCYGCLSTPLILMTFMYLSIQIKVLTLNLAN